MKNSLFKRAIAAVATVPLALTQCLTYSYAVTTNDAVIPAKGAVKATNDAQTITLDKLLYIAPEETESSWNTLLSQYIQKVEAKGKSTGTIDLSNLVDSAIAKLGSANKGVAKQVAARILENEATYEIVDGDIIIKGKVSQPNFNGNIQNTPGQALSALASKYNAQ